VSPVAGVVEVELCHSTVQRGSWEREKDTKCSRTLAEPGVPGTRGMRIGESRAPVWMSKSWPPDGTVRRLASERGA
jgi:hypothetical protein